MIKLKDLLNERVDFHLVASDLVEYYGLKSKVKFGGGKNEGDYNWTTDTIYLRKSYPSVKELIVSVLHEIKHAIDVKRMGKSKYEKAYQHAGDMAVNQGKDFHDDNKFEEITEKWAQKQYNSKWKNKF
ncbi:MAG: hypothetical protein H8E03_01440 [Pelagibacteraceae bacterium]|nr:hypothetical protein [Pelagibacteraceae bacterium]